jgi:hypothetical protein
VSRKWGADMKYDMRAGRYVIRRNAQILDVDRYRLPPCIYMPWDPVRVMQTTETIE